MNAEEIRKLYLEARKLSSLTRTPEQEALVCLGDLVRGHFIVQDAVDRRQSILRPRSWDERTLRSAVRLDGEHAIGRSA